MFSAEISQYVTAIYHTFGELGVFENHLRNNNICSDRQRQP